MRPVWPMAACAVLLAACDPPEMISERGDFRLAVEGLRLVDDRLPDRDWQAPYLVLAGTRLCPELLCDACADPDACDDAAVHASGPIGVDGGCFVTEGPGEVVWTVDPPCGPADQEPDRVRMRVLAADEVEARVYHWIDAKVAHHAAGDHPIVTTLGAAWPELLPRDLKIVAGEQVQLEVGLFERATGHNVAHQAEPAAEVTWISTSGRPAIAYPSERVDLLTFAGSRSTGSFRFADHTWPLGQVTGVAAESVTSLELAGALFHPEDPNAPLLGRTAWPLGARAVARDDAGDLVVGLPVAWTVEAGDIAYWANESSHEWLVLADDCVAPEERAGPRELVLRGHGGGLSASLRFAWAGTSDTTFLNTAEAGADWAPPATCLSPAGCDCRSADLGGASLLLLGLLALARRRKAGVLAGMPDRAWRNGHVSKNMVIGTCLLGLPAAGCGEDPPAMRAAEAIPLGALPLDLRILQGGHSLRVGDRALWTFRADTDLPWADSEATAAAVTPDLDARDGLHPFALYETAEEHDDDELLPYLDREASYRYEHDDGACIEADNCPQVSLWPGPMVHDPQRQRVLIFYRKVIQFEDSTDNRHVGSSIAVWRDDLAGRPVRPTVAEGSAEPTLLFGADGPRLAAAALTEEEFVYAFACDGKHGACTLLRAPLATALTRADWRFLGPEGEWSTSARGAEELFDGASAMSVHHSEHADAYVAVYADREQSAVVLRTAPRLQGPWSDAAELYRPGATPAPPRVRDAMLHPELARDGGAVDYLTFFEAARGSLIDAYGVRQLVEIHWE